jgi:hypothetical protein
MAGDAIPEVGLLEVIPALGVDHGRMTGKSEVIELLSR